MTDLYNPTAIWFSKPTLASVVGQHREDNSLCGSYGGVMEFWQT